MTRLGKSYSTSIKRFELERLQDMAKEYDDGIDGLLAMYIIGQIDRERNLVKKRYEQLGMSALQRPPDSTIETAVPDDTKRPSAVGGTMYGYTPPEDRNGNESVAGPISEISYTDTVRLRIRLSEGLRREMETFLNEGTVRYASSQLVRLAIDNALLPPDPEIS